MEEQITSLVITKVAPSYWTYLANEDISGDANAYTGTSNGDYITIKSRTGAPLLNNVYFGVVEYYDNLDSTNNLLNPSSRQELQGHLIAQGFYEGSTGGGTGGVTTFKALLDTFPSFAGRAGQVVKVNDAETFLTSEMVSFVQKLTDLSDWQGGGDAYPPDVYLKSTTQVDEDGNAVGFTYAPISQVVNRPFLYAEAGVTHKGATVVDGEIVANPEQYTPEVGDLVSFFAYDETENRIYKYIDAKWLGGSMSDPANYDWAFRLVYADNVL